MSQRQRFTSIILLAGGASARMGGGTPKQFRILQGKALVLYSYEFFDESPDVGEIVVVCAPEYRALFALAAKPVRFALPGPRRQDSVYNGLLATTEEADLICVHDSARPFLEKDSFAALLKEARKTGAAALALPAANTIKEADSRGIVKQTLPRNDLWEMQTPQAIRRDLFLKAYDYARQHNLEATDDLSLVEAIGAPASLVKGSPRTFKITTPFDWQVAETCAAN